MKYVDLGGRSVSAVGLGLWQFGSEQWRRPDFDDTTARQIIERSLELGVNFFDTAELYGHGRSEEILGNALAGRRDEAFIASKVSPFHLTRSGVLRAAAGSLTRLQTTHLDLYQVHWPNRFVPIARTMAGMRDLLESGRVAQVGVSNFSQERWQAAEGALGTKVVANQVQFNLLDRKPLHDLVSFAQTGEKIIIAYSPLAQGALGGRYGVGTRPSDFRTGNPLFSAESFERLQPLMNAQKAIAEHHSATSAQIALAWLLHIPRVIVIPGATSLRQVEDNAAAADIALSDEEWRQLDELAASVQPPQTKRMLSRIAGRILGA